MQHPRATTLVTIAWLAGACAPQSVVREPVELDGGAVAPVPGQRPGERADGPPARLDAWPSDAPGAIPRDAALRPPDAPAPPDGGGGGAIDPPVPPVRTPDAAVGAPAGPLALLVVGSVDPLGTDDAQLRSRLESSGLRVRLAADSGPASQAAGANLVVISGTTLGGNVAGKYTALPIPLVCLEPAVMAPMRLTGADDNGQGNATGSQVTITAAQHPLAAGLSGTVTVTATAVNFGWGLPAESATRVAHLAGMANRWAIFSYERGAMLVGAPATPAPARRVGLFVHTMVADRLTPAGWELFDAAVAWALAAR